MRDLTQVSDKLFFKTSTGFIMKNSTRFSCVGLKLTLQRRGKVISAPEFNRIQASLNAKETEAATRQKKEQEKDRLRDLR